MNHLEYRHGFDLITLIDDVYSLTPSVDGFLTKLGQKMGNEPKRDPINLMHIRMNVQMGLFFSQQFINLDKKILESVYGYLEGCLIHLNVRGLLSLGRGMLSTQGHFLFNLK